MIQIRNIQQNEYSVTQQALRLNNTTLLFNLIRDTMPISRIELAKQSPFSSSTISNLVDELLQQQWIIETIKTQNSARGRRSTMLEVNAQRGFVATVELLGRGYICTLYDICLKKIASTQMQDTIYNSASIVSTIRNLIKNNHQSPDKLLGIHLIYPGVVDEISGELLSSVAFPESDALDRYIVIQLKKHFRDAHVMVSTNGTIIAFQEFMQHSQLSRLPLLSLNIDEAIFGGMVVSDTDKNMTFCYPVELGHLMVDYRGECCTCGNRGCLETVCRTPKLFEALNSRAGLNLKYSNSFGSALNTGNMSIIADLLQQGHPQVADVLQEYTDILCMAIGSISNMLGVRSVHVGGDIALLGVPFLNMFRKTFYNHFVPLNSADRTRIELFVNDYEQTRLAASLMCVDAIFRK